MRYYDRNIHKNKRFNPLPNGTAVKVETINRRVFYGAVVPNREFKDGIAIVSGEKVHEFSFPQTNSITILEEKC